MSVLIRPSSVHSFFDCPYRWAQIHLLGIRSFGNFQTLRGTGVHAGAEEIWEESQKAGSKTFSLSAAKDRAAETVEKRVEEEEFRFEDFETPEQAKDDAVKGVEVYAKEIVPKVDIPIQVEHYFEAELDDDIKIGGTTDSINPDGKIRDIKTSTRKVQPSKYIEQLSIYKRLAEVNDIKTQDKAIIENVVFLKNNIGAHVMEVQIDVEGTKRKIDDIVKRIKLWKEANDEFGKLDILFPPNPNSFMCSEKFCPIYNSCYIKNDVPV
ncbi:PD-(D/E)XK nuclease family protein [Nitratiruptor sp. SB155-2]|uniref:PD-(D/E)XK nuclease family protein n=1 Tax=Nitratiruptor sp. (strain SB155-2) TaxID=387092 RepID=UPI0001586F31|nr:PD-(D/E)XK nuclease family protein [Nitratiruptor sp. SB155-2]BAF69568.1 hypothetical protein NIS_0454 [Nitratiruptor sp. SB155-2]BAN05326.1 RecB protein [Nitratiruptor phage NrS-1]